MPSNFMAMESDSRMKTLRGIIVPMITPLRRADALDVDGLERLIEHTISGGVSGLFILGTTGEFSGLSYKVRHELIERVCRQVNKRVPVLVGIADTSFTESVNLSRKAADSGADAVVSAPPYYFMAGLPELVRYYEHLNAQLPLPMYLYNMPAHTKVSLSPETVRIIAENKNVAGFKDSSHDSVYFNMIQHIMKDRPDFSLFVGPELMMVEVVLMGAHGGVNGGANIFPRLYVDLYEAAVAKDFKRIHELQDKVRYINATIYTQGKHQSSLITGIKCALSVLGICNDFMTEPFSRFGEPERKTILHHLDKLNIPLPV